MAGMADDGKERRIIPPVIVQVVDGKLSSRLNRSLAGLATLPPHRDDLLAQFRRAGDAALLPRTTLHIGCANRHELQVALNRVDGLIALFGRFPFTSRALASHLGWQIWVGVGLLSHSPLVGRWLRL